MQYKKYKQYRLPGYDYSEEGNYFVTICTFNREEYFGEIINDEMILSDAGKIVGQIWNEIPNKFENVKLDVHQIMPDHFHGIITIKSECHRNLVNQENLTRLLDAQVNQKNLINQKNITIEKNFTFKPAYFFY